MANDETQLARRQAQKIQTVDSGRPVADPFKLPASLRALLDSRLSALDALGTLPEEVEGKRVGASSKVKAAFAELRELLKEGFDGVSATSKRNTATTLLDKALRRVRYHYCSVSDDCDETPELAKVGFQPVRRSGQRLIASEQPVSELLGPPEAG